MTFWVTITEKGGKPQKRDFDQNEVTIGRVQGNDIVRVEVVNERAEGHAVVPAGREVVDLYILRGGEALGQYLLYAVLWEAGTSHHTLQAHTLCTALVSYGFFCGLFIHGGL